MQSQFSKASEELPIRVTSLWSARIARIFGFKKDGFTTSLAMDLLFVRSHRAPPRRSSVERPVARRHQRPRPAMVLWSQKWWFRRQGTHCSCPPSALTCSCRPSRIWKATRFLGTSAGKKNKSWQLCPASYLDIVSTESMRNGKGALAASRWTTYRNELLKASNDPCHGICTLPSERTPLRRGNSVIHWQLRRRKQLT